MRNEPSGTSKPPGASRDILRSRAGRQALGLLRNGQFRAARMLFVQLATRDPMSKPAHHALAALLAKEGRLDEARALLRAFFSRCPVSPNAREIAARGDLVLRIRGFDKTRPTLKLGKDGLYKPSFRGGHFTLRYLLERRDFALLTYTLVAGTRIDPERMPPHALLINSIAEPDIEGGSLKSLERFLAETGIRNIINRPERIWHTARDRNYQRLRAMPGLRFPRTERARFRNAGHEEVETWLNQAGFGWPVIMRRTGTQTGRTSYLLATRDDLRAMCAGGLSGEYYAIAYHEILWREKYFRKLRLFWIDGDFYPVVCHIDRTWNVHGGNRKTLMLGNQALMDEEKRFLGHWQDYVGTRNVEALHRVAEDTGLDFFGIDFNLDDCGRVFIYELNPAMRHSYDHAENFPYKKPHDEAITEAFTKMVRSRIVTSPAAT